MPRDAELEEEVGDALEAFLKAGGCGHKTRYDADSAKVRKCCVIAFIAGTSSENVYPESAEDLEAEDEEDVDAEEAPTDD